MGKERTVVGDLAGSPVGGGKRAELGKRHRAQFIDQVRQVSPKLQVPVVGGDRVGHEFRIAVEREIGDRGGVVVDVDETTIALGVDLRIQLDDLIHDGPAHACHIGVVRRAVIPLRQGDLVPVDPPLRLAVVATSGVSVVEKTDQLANAAGDRRGREIRVFFQGANRDGGKNHVVPGFARLLDVLLQRLGNAVDEAFVRLLFREGGEEF